MSSDEVVKSSSYESSTGNFTVPPRTTSVFVEPRNIWVVFVCCKFHLQLVPILDHGEAKSITRAKGIKVPCLLMGIILASTAMALRNMFFFWRSVLEKILVLVCEIKAEIRGWWLKDYMRATSKLIFCIFIVFFFFINKSIQIIMRVIIITVKQSIFFFL